MYTSGHLFSGGWGDGRGFMNAGYAPRFGANHNPAAVATARANVPGLYVREAAIQTIDMRTLPYATAWSARRSAGKPPLQAATPRPASRKSSMSARARWPSRAGGSRPG
ncbi:hypothetical protein GCM10023336_67500 [Streptomyces similanensis]|uniref:Uncharacterized protein n=1 Tax=Streptomyces similanensis TaxID=1274988 RepID=A0ABP9LJ66_9ACTN